MSTKCYWVMTLVYYIYVYTCHTKMSHVREQWQIISHMTHFCVTWLISVWYLMTHRIHAAWLISATDMNIRNGFEYRIWGYSYPLRIFISVISDIHIRHIRYSYPDRSWYPQRISLILISATDRSWHPQLISAHIRNGYENMTWYLQRIWGYELISDMSWYFYMYLAKVLTYVSTHICNGYASLSRSYTCHVYEWHI